MRGRGFTSERHGNIIRLMRLALFFVLSGLLPVCVAQPLKWHANVRVRYYASESFQSQIRSYLSRELRALGDVDETDVNPDYTVTVSAITNTIGGGSHGYAIHVSVAVPAESFLPTTLLLLKLDQENQKFINQYLTGYEHLENATMYIWPESNLGELAKKIVTEDVDSVFEDGRKARRKALDLMNSKRK